MWKNVEKTPLQDQRRRESRRRNRKRRRRLQTCIICLEGRDAGRLFNPCKCSKKSIGRYHYRCLVDWIVVHADRVCPNCKTQFRHKQIERYLWEPTLCEALKRVFTTSPEGEPPLWTTFTLFGINGMFFLGLISMRTPGFLVLHPSLNLILFLVLVFWLIDDTVRAVLTVYRDFPHRMVRFTEYVGAPNNVRILDATLRERQLRAEEVQEQQLLVIQDMNLIE